MYLKITQQMGLKYMLFRASYELKKKSGYLEVKFPTVLKETELQSLDNWKINAQLFFQWDINSISKPSEIGITELNQNVDCIKKGDIQYFSGKRYNTPLDEWHLNPLTGYTYSRTKHWTQISEFTKEAGDIKFVWEKARFSWVYDFIRNDQHTNSDSSVFVFNSIDSFINQNPINQGPNYICSQEISLRVLNWTFALDYYKESIALDQNRFDRIMKSINAQIVHVYSNINFSRIAVRNNHAITETLTIYLIGLLFPFLPDAKKWKVKGKKWFEKEIEFQIYEDGSYLQYSMNYHRVVVQLLTWAIVLSENNKEQLDPIVYERGKKTIAFLEGCQDPVSGQLPHYGANDGALFFPLSNAKYRDYRPQINALKAALKISFSEKLDKNSSHELLWYGLKPNFVNDITKKQAEGRINKTTNKQQSNSNRFSSGGYYTFKEGNTLTFIRCGSHKNRPSQSDNLHLDVWVNGINVLRDSGTFLYNGDSSEVAFYNSTKAHNTVQLGDEDQMIKGERFIWFNWSKAIKSTIKEDEDYWYFEGIIIAFNGIKLKRRIKKYKHELIWEIQDEVISKTNKKLMHQHWHPNFSTGINISISGTDSLGKSVISRNTKGWFAPNYGESISSPIHTFTTNGNFLCTRIEVIVQ